MPIHDWSRVDAGIFHHFHQRWIGAITDVLNQRLLPGEYYTLIEQQSDRHEPDVTAETDLEFYRRKQNVVAVRHVSGDHLVALVEVVSKGNKSGRKADEFLSRGIHRLFLDLQEFAVGDTPIDMPLFLEPGRHVAVPIDETYRLAFQSVPRRWRMVLEPG